MRRLSRTILLILLCHLTVLPGQAAALQTAGKSALLMEVATGTVLYEQDPHQRLSPASVTKVMTMLLIMEAVDSGRISMTDTVTASETAAAKGGSQIFLKAGETMPVSDMLKSIAVSSANDCACAMAEHLAGSEEAFVALMNRRAEELGMADTHFVNCTGLDDDGNAKDHKTSAYDIALMSRELLKNHPRIREFTTIWMDTVRNGTFGLSNTNKLVRFYEGATGLKTGYTSGAGYCLSASDQREGMELVAVVMGADTSSARNAACKQLLDYGFANYALITPELTGPGSVPVKLGAADTAEAVLSDRTPLLIEKARRSGITMDTRLEGPLTAPVSRGQRLGTLSVMDGDRELARIPLVSSDAVPRLGWGQLFAKVLRQAAMSED